MRTPDEAYLRKRVKQELRRRFKALRNTMPQEARVARSSAAAEVAVGLPCINASPLTVASFVAVRGEIDTEPLELKLRAAGALIAYPAIDMDADKIVFRLSERAALSEGAFGIPEPPSEAPLAETIDVVLVPALAVDPRGHRVGYGKGFYDQLMPTLGAAIRVAYVYDFQLVPETPNEPFDHAVHFVVSDRRSLECDPGPLGESS